MAVGNLNITITLNNGQFTAALNQSGSALQSFTGQVRGANNAVTTAGASFAKFGTRLRDTVVTLGLARNAVLNVWTVFGALPARMVKVTAEFERMNVLLTNMSTKSSFAEKMADGKVQFEQIIDLSRRAPFSIAAIQDAWVKFKSAGLDPANGSLKSLLDAVAAFGGTDDILKRASIAIQQMAGKGVISMEELRQQLGEAVPTAMQNLADSAGISVQELAKKIAKGGVQAQESLKSLFIEFERLYGGQAEKLVNTFSGQVSILTTEMKLFSQQVVTDSGLFATLKDVIRQLADAFKDPQFIAAVTKLATGLASVIKEVITFTTWIAKNAGEIVQWTATIGAAVVGGRLVAPMLMSIGGAAVVAGKAMRDFILWMQILVGIFVSSGLKAGIANTIALLRGLFVLSPAGWVAATVAGLAAVTAWLISTGREADKARDKMRMFWESANEKDIADAEKALEKRRKDIKSIDDELAAGFRVSMGMDGTGVVVPLTPADKAALRTRKEQLIQAIQQEASDIRRAREALSNREADQQAQRFQFDIKQQLDQIKDRKLAEQTAERTAINEKIRDAKVAAKQYRDFVITNEDKFRDETTAYLQKKIDEQQAKLASATTEAQKRTIRLNIDYLKETLNSVNGLTDAAIASRNAGLQDMNAGTGEDKDPLAKFVNGLERKIASLRALLDGEKELPAEVADFLERVQMSADGRSGTFDGQVYSAEQIARAQQFVATQALTKDAWEKEKNAITQSKYALDGMATLLASTTAEYEKWNRVLQTGGIDQTSSSLNSINKQLEKFAENIRPEQREEFEKMRAAILGMAKDSAGAEKIVELMKISDENKVKLLTTAAEQRAFEVARFKETIDLYIRQNQLTEEQKQKLLELRDVILAQQEDISKLETPLGQLAKNWADTTERMKEATANWVSSGIDALIDFAMTGKSSFGDLAKAILKDIARIIIRAMIAQAILSALGIAPGQTTSTGSAFKDILGNAFGANIKPGAVPATGSAMGNVMTEWGPAPLRRWGEGGIAKRPMVSVFGEGSQPEAYVPLPDGRTIPVTVKGRMQGGEAPPVTVNVINQTGQQVSAEQRGQPKFDGNGFVLDVVMKAVNQPGQFRDSMRQAMR